MDIESQMHIAPEISSYPADVETEDSYTDRIGHYEAKNFTFIPMPKDGSYYNTEEGWIKDIEDRQYIDEDTHLMEVLRRMQRYPFLLVDRLDGISYYVVKEDGEKFALPDSSLRIVAEGNEYISDKMKEYPAEEIMENNEEMSVHDLREDHPELAEDYLTYDYDEQYEIITLVDLNKRGMKQMLYKVISELSATLGQKIEKQYPDSEEIQKHMRPVTIGRWKKDKINGLQMHISEHMNLLEMMQVIQASNKEFVNECGFESKSDVQTLNSINDIRNRVMHANRSLIYDRKEIQEVIDVVNESQRIISNIS